MKALQMWDIEGSRPNRLNFAGWCIYCGGRDCREARCIAMHDRSVWAVCDRCEGSEYVDWESTCMDRCTCTGGLREVTAAHRLSLVPTPDEGGFRFSDPGYRPVPGMAHVPGWGL